MFLNVIKNHRKYLNLNLLNINKFYKLRDKHCNVIQTLGYFHDNNLNILKVTYIKRETTLRINEKKII